MVEFFITIRADPTLLALLNQIYSSLGQIIAKENKIMSTLQDDVNAVAAETTVIGGLTVFIQGLQAQIAALPGLTPAMQNQIDSIFANETANAASITAAMAINTTQTAIPTVVPPVVVA